MSHQAIPVKMLANPVHFLSLGLGSGLSPVMPGTMGTAVAALLWWLASLSWPDSGPNLLYYFGFLILATILGVYLCGRTAKALGVHDHGGIVWDEFVGFWVAMIALPANWIWLLSGFVLFRLFDILKPWPIRQIDKTVGGGWGIMLDDLLAGVYTLVILQLVLWWVS